MKRIFLLLSLFIMFSLLLGMGSLQGPASPDKIPIPAKKYVAVYIDQMDIVTECEEVSIEGATYLEGKRGEGTYTISFDNIDYMLLRLNQEKLTGMIKLRDGGTSELILNKNQRAFGKTKYGTYQIKLADLKKLLIRLENKR